MSMFPISQLIKVAELYYYRKMSQKEISLELNISPATVSRMFQEALNIGLVKVEIREISGDFQQLARELEARYGLEKAVVVQSPEQKNDWHLKKLLGKAASELFYETARSGDLIGIGPGETMLETISSLHYESALMDVHLLPLMGGWGSALLQRENNKLVITMASILQCDYSLVPAPAFVSSPEVKEIFLREDQVKHVTQLWADLDLALFSIGPELKRNMYTTLAPDQNDIANTEKVVGDIVGKLIDGAGNELDHVYNKKIISIPFSLLKQVPKRIGVGGGPYKYRALKGALKGRFFNYLVTDHNTATRILESGDDIDSI